MSSKKKWYAIKAIDGIEVDNIVTSWKECKEQVYYHKSIYKSFFTEEEAKRYLINMNEEKQEKYIAQMEYGMDKRRRLKKQSKQIVLNVPLDVYEQFSTKVGKLQYKFNDVVIDVMRDWCLD